MKFSKKMMFGAVALMMAASLVFTGCRDEEGSADVNISWSGNGNIATVFGTNDSDDLYARKYETMKTKHIDYTATATWNKGNNGVIGVMFGMSKNADGTYNFGVVGLGDTGGTNPRYYVNHYVNVDPLSMVGSANDFLNKDGQKAHVDGDCPWTDLKGITADEDGNFTVAIIVALEGEEDKDGYYKVTLGTKLEADGKIIKAENIKGTKEVGKTTKFTDKDGNNVKNSATLSKCSQTDVGVYANVYTGKSLSAKVAFADIRKYDDVADGE
ncbi:MAG: hypothetical protein MSA27_08700 [Spirochaetia bacterium]|nr:hypothetical protein [Spirochaetia bacterium]